MNCGIIDLFAYTSKQSYERIKNHYYFYDKLYTYNFYEFEQAQLNLMGGKKSHYDKVKLLIDQGLLEIMDSSMDDIQDDDFCNLLSIVDNQYINYLSANNNFQDVVTELANERTTEAEMQNAFKISQMSTLKLLALKERLYGLIQSKRLNQSIYPTLSLDCYNSINMNASNKGNIYNILISNLPVPHGQTPLVDIIEYKNLPSNQLKFKRLQSWVNKFSKEDFSLKEITQEIEYLIEEYRHDLKLSGMQEKLINIEFCSKILPHVLEKFVKFSFSELLDPLFKWKYEKISLLKEEANVKGSELAYVINSA